MLVSVIVVSFNSGPLLVECVCRALASTIAVEVIVSDNGSDDCSLAAVMALAEADPRLTVVLNGDNLGFAAANNKVLKHAQGDYVLFLNPDCLVEPATLEQVALALQSRPEAAMAGALIRNPDGSEQAGCRRDEPTPRRLVSNALGLATAGGRDAALAADALAAPEVVKAVDVISGAFMLIRREALCSLGSFDEAYFMHWEDVDLCTRMRRAGHTHRVCPRSRGTAFQRPLQSARAAAGGMAQASGNGAVFEKVVFRRLAGPALLAIVAADLVALLFMALRPARVPDQAPLPVASVPDARGDAANDEVWVFGASSPVGRCLVPHLIAHGHAVRAFSRRSSALNGEGGLRLHWDTRDIAVDSLADITAQPRIVIHLAPLDLLPRHLEVLLQKGVRQLIAFGTTSVFTKHNGSAREQAQMQRLRDAEQAIAAACSGTTVCWSVFRPTIIYSPSSGRGLGLLARFIRVFRFVPVLGTARGLRQPVHADDLARACLSLLSSEHGWNQPYNLSGGEVLSYREMLIRIFRQQGRVPRIIRFPERLARLALSLLRLWPAYRDMHIDMLRRADTDMAFDHAPARAAFGYAPRSFLP